MVLEFILRFNGWPFCFSKRGFDCCQACDCSQTGSRIGLDFFYMFKFGGRMPLPPPPRIIFVVCGPIPTKFCAGIDNQTVNSNMEKNYIKFMKS